MWPVDERTLPTNNDILDLMQMIRLGKETKICFLECVKSKIVTGIKITESQISKFHKFNHHLCDVCARSNSHGIVLTKFTKFEENEWEAMYPVTLLYL